MISSNFFTPNNLIEEIKENAEGEEDDEENNSIDKIS